MCLYRGLLAQRRVHAKELKPERVLAYVRRVEEVCVSRDEAHEFKPALEALMPPPAVASVPAPCAAAVTPVTSVTSDTPKGP